MLPFPKSTWVIDKKNPSKPGIITGKFRPLGHLIQVEVEYGPNDRKYLLSHNLSQVGDDTGSVEDIFQNESFGKIRDLQRIITFEKLKGKLNDVIYSMEAAQIDFYPYQFKPVMKFINSPTQRILLADEVGLGKTIEAALVWLELQSRQQARRLLIVCPNILAIKWRDELKKKFLLDARIVDANDLLYEIKEVKQNGPGHEFVLIATYSGLRPYKSEFRAIENEAAELKTKRGELCREMVFWEYENDIFDMVVFDEAHYMRNTASSTHKLAEILSRVTASLICVSATPINNKNEDLHALLKLIDEDFFSIPFIYESLLRENKPAVQLMNALSRTPIDYKKVAELTSGLKDSRFIGKSPHLKELNEKLEVLGQNSLNSADLVKMQSLADKLNILGSYLCRTRRVQVKENRAIRVPHVLEMDFSEAEMSFYNKILQLVRKKCQVEGKVFHAFQSIGIQLMSASSLAVVAEEFKRGRYQDLQELFDESFGLEDESEYSWDNDNDWDELKRFLDYDFRDNDSKYKKLLEYLKNTESNDKIIIFSYYRGTLNYLAERLKEDGFLNRMIHGGIKKQEDRWKALEDFEHNPNIRVLLSSEVGSEGIDLQFSRILINYDLPWNPMRVEQRIGRIDRVGQKNERLIIVNFKIKGTIEEKVYDKLHQKLLLFKNSLGDLEEILGQEIQRLSADLLSKELSEKQIQVRIEQTEQVITRRAEDMQELENSSESLLGLNDYLQEKIRDIRKNKGYIHSRELEVYVRDFFERHFKGTEIYWNTPKKGCFKINLSEAAKASIREFIRDDQSLSAYPFRINAPVLLSFDQNISKNLNDRSTKVYYQNHMSPFIRWITKINLDQSSDFFRLSALAINAIDCQLKPGIYLYRLERWRFQGLSIEESIASIVKSINPGETSLTVEESDQVIKQLLDYASNWDYPKFQKEDAVKVLEEVENILSNVNAERLEEFTNNNTHNYNLQKQRIEDQFNRKIKLEERRLENAHSNSDPSKRSTLIKSATTRKKNVELAKAAKVDELKRKSETDSSMSEVASGIFLVKG